MAISKNIIKIKTGKYAVIGDIHSCYEHLVLLLNKLGYVVDGTELVKVNEDRKLIFVGDLTDRGEHPVKVLALVMNLIEQKVAYMVYGNHEDKLKKALQGRNVKINSHLEHTINSIKAKGDDFVYKVIQFIDNLPYQIVTDDDLLVVAHGGAKEDLQSIDSKASKSFALYGDATGKMDEKGYPIRRNWGKAYKGSRAVIYGHQIIDVPKWVNNTIDIDTGCFKTGTLSAVLWPEREIVQIKKKFINAYFSEDE